LEHTTIEILPPEEAYFAPPKTEASEAGMDRVIDLVDNQDRNVISMLIHMVKISSHKGPVVQIIMQAIANNPVRFKHFLESLAPPI